MLLMRLIQTWKNISISKKLYIVVGIMATLIATELFTLLFAMNILSAVRAFVGGEALWSKGQKDAVHALEKYALSGNPIFYGKFMASMEIPMGDHEARLGLESPELDLKRVTSGFIAGG